MGARVLVLPLLLFACTGCRKSAVLQAGEVLGPADDGGNTQSYIAKPPPGWQMGTERTQDFLVEGGDSRLTVMVHWEPKKELLEGLEITDADSFYQVMISPELKQGGKSIEIGEFSGVIRSSVPGKLSKDFFGKENILLTVQDGLSFIMINARVNSGDITLQEVIDFAKTIRRP